MAHAELNLAEPHNSKVSINGNNISGCIRSIRVYQNTETMPTIALHLEVHKVNCLVDGSIAINGIQIDKEMEIALFKHLKEKFDTEVEDDGTI